MTNPTDIYTADTEHATNPNNQPNYLERACEFMRTQTALTAGTHPNNVTVHVEPATLQPKTNPNDPDTWITRKWAIVTHQPGDYPLTDTQHWQALESERHRTTNNHRASNGHEPIPY